MWMSVSLSVICGSFDFTLNFTMVMGSFTGKYVLIVIDQSERVQREGVE